MAFQRLAGLFDNTQMKKKSNKLFKALKRAEQLSDLFQHFTMNEWIYMTSHIEEMENYLTPEERKLFNLNPKDIQWKKYLLYFAWGLRYFILKEQCDVPAQGDRADLLTSTGAHRVSTLKWLFSRGFDFKPTETAIIKQKIMASNRVRNVIRDIVVNRSTNMSDSEFEAYLTKVAEKNCDFILSTYDIKWIRFTGLIIHTALKKIYEKIVVDEKALEKIRQYDQKKNGPLIFMPTHRSYLDFILVSYIFYTFSIKCPHIVAAEDFLGIALVHHLLRGSGALFIRRKKVEYMEIYWAVLYEYIQTLLIDESWLEFFIEGTRSRYGKTLAPKLGILNMVCDTVFDNKIPNAHILPITMSYERVIEGEAYPLELLGEEKKKESLGRLIGALNILAMNFGRVYVEFCDTISIKQYAEDFMEKSGHTKNPYTNSKDREALVHSLGYEVVYRLNENLIIMPTAIVSSLLLLHRKGISEEMLMQKVEWLKNQILERGGRIGGIDENSSLKTIKGAITHLQHLVEQKKDIVHLQVSAKSDYKNVLMLAYYRNMLLHVFWHECLVACALSSFGQEIAWKEGLSAERLWEELSFLAELMSREVHLRTPITKSNYMSLINAMVDRKVLSYKDNKIRVIPICLSLIFQGC
jgi:Glycerol-3-phosphate O-acyltransferase